MKDSGVDYIRHVLLEKDWTAAELARRAKVSHSTINRPLTIADYPNAISRQTLKKVYEASRIDPRPFLEAAGEPAIVLTLNGDDAQSGDALVPVYDVQASAGFGSLVDYEEQTHSLAFPPDYLRKLTSSPAKNLVIISASGDSMEPTLLDHDIVLIDTSKTHLGYEGMFVLRHNDTLLVKRAGMAATAGSVTLLSDNKAYPPVEAQLADLHVVGKVLWYGRKV